MTPIGSAVSCFGLPSTRRTLI